MGESLNVTVPALPAKGKSREEDFRNALDTESKQEQGRAGNRQRAWPAGGNVPRSAMSSLTLLLVYQTNSPKLKGQLLDSIKRAGLQSGVPDQYWKPVVETAEAGASLGEFTSAVRNMLENVTKHFAAKSNTQPAEESKKSS